MKVLYNACYGGFSVSEEFIDEYNTRNPDRPLVSTYDVDPEDTLAVAVFEDLGSEKSSGGCAKLKCKEIPYGFTYVITEYDGLETVRIKPDVDRDKIIDDLLMLVKNREYKPSYSHTVRLLESGLNMKEYIGQMWAASRELKRITK